VWTGFKCLRIRSSGEITSEHDNESLGFIQGVKFDDQLCDYQVLKNDSAQ